MKKVLLILSGILLLSITVLSKSYSPGTYYGSSTSKHYKGFYYTNVALVHVNQNGSIDEVYIDSTFPVDIKDLSKGFTTKQVLGDTYGMRKASKIGKEWNEQADAIAQSVVNNQGISFKIKENKRTDGVAGASIKVTPYVEALNVALNKAQK